MGKSHRQLKRRLTSVLDRLAIVSRGFPERGALPFTKAEFNQLGDLLEGQETEFGVVIVIGPPNSKFLNAPYRDWNRRSLGAPAFLAGTKTEKISLALPLLLLSALAPSCHCGSFGKRFPLLGRHPGEANLRASSAQGDCGGVLSTRHDHHYTQRQARPPIPEQESDA